MSDELKTTTSEEETREEEAAEAQTETPVAETSPAETTTAEAIASDNGAETVTENAEPAGGEAVAPSNADRPAVSLRDRSADDDSADDEDDEEFDDEFEDADDDDSQYVEGPATYVQREKSGRARRIGSDIRFDDIDYKNIPMLSRFLDRRGRILSRRKTKVSAKVQRSIVKAIKRARHLALLPYTADHTRVVQKRGR